MAARVVQVNVNPEGGVPKLPVSEAFVGVYGVQGDLQRDVFFHGGPLRAVCLYSLELIEALQAEGHPITPGSTGENLTLSGLDWDWLAPAVRGGAAGGAGATWRCRGVAAGVSAG
jgi:MOSC domain-containing protein YiiM